MSARVTRPGGARSSSWWVALLLLAAAGCAYWPVLDAGFVWDDDLHLTDNVVLSPGGLYRMWVLREVPIYYPVAFTTYWLEHRIWGLDPRGYHVVNVLLHAANAWLFFRLLVVMRCLAPIAVVAALLFAVHPQNVESVAWIAQRKNLLSMLFLLVALHAYWRFDAEGDGGGGTARRAALHLAALGCFGLGMLSKGAIAPLPFVLLLLVAWRRGLGEPPREAADEPWRRPIRGVDLALLLPFLLLGVALTLQEVLGQRAVVGEDVVREQSLPAMLAGAGHVAWFYVGKTAAPFGLSFVYPRWSVDAARLVDWLPTLGALGALAGAALVWRRGGPLAPAGRVGTFVLLYYALMIGPVLGFADFYFLRYSRVADHYQYYAQLGLVTLAACALHQLTRLGPRGRAGFVAASAALALMLGVLTFRQAHAYHDEETLWRDTLAKNPDASLALNNLARLLAARGDRAEALPLFVRATEVDPGNREAWRNAGLLFEAADRPDRALAGYRRALAAWPGEAQSWTKPAGEATLAEAHVRLGLQLALIGQQAAAVGHYRAALRADPDDASARVGIADALLGQNAVRQAVRLYSEATVLAPEAPAAFERLALVFSAHPDGGLRDGARAVALGERAVALTGRGDAAALAALAGAYAEAGRRDEAVATIDEAIAVARAAGWQALQEPLAEQRARHLRGEPSRGFSVRLKRPAPGERLPH